MTTLVRKFLNLVYVDTGGGTTPPPPVNAPGGVWSMGYESFNKNLADSPKWDLAELYAHPNCYDGACCVLEWRQMMPSMSGPPDFSKIDLFKTNLAAYNAAHTRKAMGKIRIFCGPHAPTDVINMDANGNPTTSPMSLYYSIPNNQYEQLPTGLYWTVPYQTQWRRLLTALAAYVDNDPAFTEIAVSTGAVNTAEPFSSPAGTQNDPILNSFGYTDAQLQQRLMDAYDDYAPFTRLFIDYAINGFPYNPPHAGAAAQSTAFVQSLIDTGRTRLGGRLILSNHGLAESETPASQGYSVRQQISAKGPPTYYQTLAPTTDQQLFVNNAIVLGATGIELFDSSDSDGAATTSDTLLNSFSADFPVSY